MRSYHALTAAVTLFCAPLGCYVGSGNCTTGEHIADAGNGSAIVTDGDGGAGGGAIAPPDPATSCGTCDDGNDCTDDVCTPEGCINPPRAHGSPCIGGLCSVDQTPGDEHGMCCSAGDCLFVFRGDAGQVSMHCATHCPDGMKCGAVTGACEIDP